MLVPNVQVHAYLSIYALRAQTLQLAQENIHIQRQLWIKVKYRQAGGPTATCVSEVNHTVCIHMGSRNLVHAAASVCGVRQDEDFHVLRRK